LAVFEWSNYERERVFMTIGSPSRFALFWQKNGWLGLIIVGLALLMLGVSAILAASDEREKSAMIQTEGTVTWLRIVPRSSGEVRVPPYLLKVDFMVDGQQITGDQRIYLTDAEKLTVGQTVPVRYLPDNPFRIWVVPEGDSSLASTLRLVGFLLLVFGLFSVWAPWVVAGNELKESRTKLPK
jgi:hypothetical protein